MKRLLLAIVVAGGVVGCRDLSHFSTPGDRFEGAVVPADFVRAGVDAKTTLCLSLDADHLQDAPGTISTSDGRFAQAPLRPIPQLWHDPLSTLSFGQGRDKNLLYVATPSADAGDSADVMVVVSLMTSGSVEVRLLRGAPVANGVTGVADGGAGGNVFAVFQLDRREGKCSY